MASYTKKPAVPEKPLRLKVAGGNIECQKMKGQASIDLREKILDILQIRLYIDKKGT